MLRLRNPQLDLWGSILPQDLLELPPELATVDMLLDDERFMEPFLQRGQQRCGRPTVPMEQYLRLMVLKHRHNLGYETLVQEVSDSIKWRRFCRIGLLDPVPHSTTISRLTQRFGENLVRELNQALVARLAEGKLIRGRKTRTDTTVMEANIEHPTDAGLLQDGVRLITRTVEKARTLGQNLAEGFRNRTRTMKKCLWEIGRFLKKRTADAAQMVVEMAGEVQEAVRDAAVKVVAGVEKNATAAVQAAKRMAGDARAALRRQVDELTARAAGAAEMTVREAREVVRRLKRSAGRLTGRAKAQATRLMGQLSRWIERTERALDQTRQRLAGVLSIPNRMVSLLDPDARPIRRGKLSRPVEFGYKLEVTQVEGKVVSDYRVHVGNPADVTLAVGVVERHIEQFGRPMDEYAADRGYHSAGNEKQLQDKGVKRVSIPARGKLSNPRQEHEKQAWFARLQRFRAGSEGSISFLKRCFGLCRSRLRGHRGAEIWTGFGVFGHNLYQAHALLVGAEARRGRRTQKYDDVCGQEPSGPDAHAPSHRPGPRLSGPGTRAMRGLVMAV